MTVANETGKAKETDIYKFKTPGKEEFFDIDVWNENMKPYLTPTVLNTFEPPLMLTGCSKDQAKELIKLFICSELADKKISISKESVVNWMFSEMEEQIRHGMTPREVIIAVNQVVDQGCQ